MDPSINKVILSGYYKNLVKIAEFIRHASEEAGFDSTTTYRVETAVDEAFTNIIEHGYGGEGIGDVECSYEINQNNLIVILKDRGKTFVPDRIKQPDIETSLENRDSHGLGLYFIRELMDEVHFEFSEEFGNTLTLIKYKE